MWCLSDVEDPLFASEVVHILCFPSELVEALWDNLVHGLGTTPLSNGGKSPWFWVALQGGAVSLAYAPWIVLSKRKIFYLLSVKFGTNYDTKIVLQIGTVSILTNTASCVTVTMPHNVGFDDIFLHCGKKNFSYVLILSFQPQSSVNIYWASLLRPGSGLSIPSKIQVYLSSSVSSAASSAAL